MKRWEVVIEYNGGNIFKHKTNQRDVFVAIAASTSELLKQCHWIDRNGELRIQDVHANQVKEEDESDCSLA